MHTCERIYWLQFSSGCMLYGRFAFIHNPQLTFENAEELFICFYITKTNTKRTHAVFA